AAHRRIRHVALRRPRVLHRAAQAARGGRAHRRRRLLRAARVREVGAARGRDREPARRGQGAAQGDVVKRAVVLLTLLGATASAAVLADYDPRSQAWNGMASFVGLAEGIGLEVTPTSMLDWSELSANDILVLVYPLQRVDPVRLGNFVQAGGNVVIADDFGDAK